MHPSPTPQPAVHAPYLYLSAPHLTGEELAYIQAVLKSNWVSTVGANLDAFEHAFQAEIGVPHALAVTSCTAALHLALRSLKIGPSDEVLASTLTFCATVNPILYQGATPVLLDSERLSWNLDPNLLEDCLRRKSMRGQNPKALILVHLYGQSGDLEAIQQICAHYGVTLIEDAAESLGGLYRGQPLGSFGLLATFSFNGNKIITTSGGGMVVSRDKALMQYIRKLAQQAREPVPHYEHAEVGYTYRMSNVLAGIGQAQLEHLSTRVAQRRANFAYYRKHLADCPGIGFMPEAPWGTSSRWLSVITIDPDRFGLTPEVLQQILHNRGIEARRVFKPMHQQAVYRACEVYGGRVANELFRTGLCLPSSSHLQKHDLDRVIGAIYEVSASKRGSSAHVLKT